jgi:hypothetical protein
MQSLTSCRYLSMLPVVLVGIWDPKHFNNCLALSNATHTGGGRRAKTIYLLAPA